VRRVASGLRGAHFPRAFPDDQFRLMCAASAFAAPVNYLPGKGKAARIKTRETFEKRPFRSRRVTLLFDFGPLREIGAGFLF